MFRISAALLATGIVAGSVVMYAGSKPEKRYPGGLESPLWNFDINSSGCHTDWIGPDSSEAANEVRFVNDKTLAMAFGTYVQSVEGPKFESKSCVFTLDVPSGKLIAQTVIDGERPFVRSRPDGNFTIGTGWKGESKTFTPELHEIEKDTFRETGKTGTGAQFGDFRTDQSGNLWFKRTGKEELLAKYGAQGSLQPLGESRMLVLAGRGFFLYTNGGELIAKETFVREGVHFAGLSSDHGRFAVSVFLWGVGDPSYLEEERIVVYDCQTGNAIASVVAEPLPTTQSWTALSPNGTFLVVGAKSQLRLFRLPASPPSHQR